MNRLECMSAFLAMEDTGIYPKCVTGKDGTKNYRSERQDGWNECIMDMTKKAETIESWLSSIPERIVELIEQDVISVTVGKEGASLYVLCNDLFYWACSDAEDFDISDLPDLENALSETNSHGGILWCCRKRGMRPQKPFYEYFSSEEKLLFDACGPERK